MKRQFFLLSIGIIAVISLFFICCQNGNTTTTSSQAELDCLLASPEYQKFSEENRLFCEQTAQALRSLSPEKQKRMDEICATITTCKDRDTFIALAKEMVTILNVDYEQHSKKMDKLAKDLFKGQKFTTDEILQAMEKRIRLQNSIPLTKTDSPTDDQYSACISGCKQSKETADMLCRDNHKHTTDADRLGCELERLSMSVICQRKCEELYQTKPVTPVTPQDSIGKTEPTPTDPVNPPVTPTN